MYSYYFDVFCFYCLSLGKDCIQRFGNLKAGNYFSDECMDLPGYFVNLEFKFPNNKITIL